MVTAASLERRLREGTELLSIVSTMKGLAAVAIHEFEEAVGALREYTRTVEQGLQIVLTRQPQLIPARTEAGERVLAVVIGTDQGLCGPINREIARQASRWLTQPALHLTDIDVIALGARVVRELDALGTPVDEEVQLASSVEGIGPLVQELIFRIERWSRDGAGRVVLFYHQPLQRTRHRPWIRQVVPPDPGRLRAIASRPWPTRTLPATPHSWEELFTGLLRQDLLIALYRAVAEAKAAEHGARLAAMQAAEQNIEERLERLQNQYHRVRQAQITAELLDVISGFEALEED